MSVLAKCEIFVREPSGLKRFIARSVTFIPSAEKMSQQFVYVHFPKAGGTSLRHQLTQEFNGKLLLDYDHHPWSVYGHETVGELPADVVGVQGHFRPHRYHSLKNAFRFTFLREPVRNLISIYFFWRGMPDNGTNPVHSRFLIEQPDIEAFARSKEHCRLMSETYFGAYDMERFDFIGIHERRQSDIPRLGKLLNVELSADVHLNQTDHEREDRNRVESDSALLRRLEDLLSDDVAFYEDQLSRRS